MKLITDTLFITGGLHDYIDMILNVIGHLSMESIF